MSDAVGRGIDKVAVGVVERERPKGTNRRHVVCCERERVLIGGIKLLPVGVYFRFIVHRIHTEISTEPHVGHHSPRGVIRSVVRHEISDQGRPGRLRTRRGGVQRFEGSARDQIQPRHIEARRQLGERRLGVGSYPDLREQCHSVRVRRIGRIVHEQSVEAGKVVGDRHVLDRIVWRPLEGLVECARRRGVAVARLKGAQRHERDAPHQV